MLVTGRGAAVVCGEWLAEGGQGVIYEVVDRPDLVFKRYRQNELTEDPTLRDRLDTMLKLEPVAEWRDADRSDVMLAWPAESVFDEGEFAGYLMPRIDWDRSARLLRVWDPSDREIAEPPTEWLRDFDWRDLVTTGSNLTLGLEALHAAEVVIGDFNDANVAVTPEGRVTFFDCDSMQLSDSGSGRRFLCRVTRPEFTAPELLGLDLRTTFRPRSSDLFALAVHLHQLLLQGEHPFRGQWHRAEDPPREQILAREGMWIFAGRPELTPRPSAVGLELLPREFADLFRRAFVDGALDPEQRPDAGEWGEALERLRTSLVPCAASDEHWYPAFFAQCPWCWQARRLRRPTGAASSPATARRAAAAARPALPSPRRRGRRGRLGWLARLAAGVVVLLAVGAALVHFHVVHVQLFTDHPRTLTPAVRHAAHPAKTPPGHGAIVVSSSSLPPHPATSKAAGATSKSAGATASTSAAR